VDTIVSPKRIDRGSERINGACSRLGVGCRGARALTIKGLLGLAFLFFFVGFSPSEPSELTFASLFLDLRTFGAGFTGFFLADLEGRLLFH